MLQNNPELKSKIDQLWNKFWSGGISNPLTAIEQITYLLFMKRLDELDLKRQSDAEFTGEKYASKFEGKWIPPEYRAKARDDDSQKETDKRHADAKMYEIDKRTLPSGVFKPYAGVSTAILLFTKVWGPKDKVTQPATEHVWFYEMAADGYSLDDKRSKQEGFGDLQDIIAKYHARNAATPDQESDRTAKCFMVPRTEIADEKNSYDLSLSRYKTDVFEEVHYDAPGVILDRLLRAELGEDFFNHETHEKHEKVLEGVQSGIVRELLELRGMIGVSD